MNDKMEKNLNLKVNIYYFANTTYVCVPQNNCRLKLLILSAYNKNIKNILLSMLSIIQNENKEILETIFTF